jgi:phosphoglycolate phosphatase
MIKLIIFDLDGTLADTIDDIGSAVNSTLSELGFNPLSRKQIISNINYGAYELIKRSLPDEYSENAEFIKNALKIYEKHYALCYSEKTYLYSGIKEALSELSKKGVLLAVLSNKQDEFVKTIIKKLLPEISFAFVMGPGAFPPKPCPDSVNFIMQGCGAKPFETAFVGDSNIDMLTAVSSLSHAVGVTWGYRSREVLLENGASILIDTPENIKEIPELIAKLQEKHGN